MNSQVYPKCFRQHPTDLEKEEKKKKIPEIEKENIALFSVVCLWMLNRAHRIEQREQFKLT